MILLPKKTHKIKIIIIILAVFFSGCIFQPKKAGAWPVTETDANAHLYWGAAVVAMPTQVTADLATAGMVGGTAPIMRASLTIPRAALKQLLKTITQSIINWINAGFNGGPSFITDPTQALLDVADQTVGDFLMSDKDLAFLCDPFKIQIKIALGLQYSVPFLEQSRCSFTSATGNIQQAMDSFYNDFEGGGGWEAWLKITQNPQNNPDGAFLMAKAEMDARVSTEKNSLTLEAGWGSGFLSMKDASGKITTPGKAIVDQLGWAQSSNIRELELAQDIDAIVGALINTAVQNGVKLLTSAFTPNGPTPREQLDAYIAQQQAINQPSASYSGSGGSSNSGSILYPNGGTPSSSGLYTPSGAVNFNQTFPNRTAAIQAINAQLAIETAYIAAQQNIYNMLAAAKNSFASSTCSGATTTYIIGKIDGSIPGLKDIPWNIIDINQATTTASTTNIAILNSTLNIINDSNTLDTAIPAIMKSINTSLITLNSTSNVGAFSATPTLGTTFSSIRTWIQSKINNNIGTCSVSTSTLSQWGIQ